MKLRLDEKEMAIILVDWAKKKYKTHNVSLTYSVDVDGKVLKEIYGDLEITLTEDQFTDAPTQLAEEAIRTIRKRLENDGSNVIQDMSEMDLSPQWSTPGQPL